MEIAEFPGDRGVRRFGWRFWAIFYHHENKQKISP
jgi:hypothetical protein